MSKHTPGPWRLSPARNALGVVLGGPARPMHHGGTTVGQIASACSQEWMESGELEANAALIAAAPELLAALQRLISSDPHIAMFPTSELEICANDKAMPQNLREQAASVIQARAVIAMVKGGAACPL